MTRIEVQWYDRQGQPISGEVALMMLANGDDFVKRTQIGDGADLRKSFTVSTIWMGVDIELGEYPQPMIFQTSVFDRKVRVADVGTATEEAALQAHAAMVEEYSKRLIDPVAVDDD